MVAHKVSKSFNDMVKGMKHHKTGTDIPKQVKKMFFKDSQGNNIHFDEEFTINVGGYGLIAKYDYDYDSDYEEGGVYEFSIMPLFEDDDKCLWAVGEVLASYDTMRISLFVEEGVIGSVCLEYQDQWDEYIVLKTFNMIGASFEQIVGDIESWLNRNCVFLPRIREIDDYKFEFWCEELSVFDYNLCADYLGWSDCRVMFDDNGGGNMDYTIFSHTDAGDYEMEGHISSYGDIGHTLREAVLFFKDCGVIEKSAKKSKSFNSMVKQERYSTKKCRK